jgi:serpin B
MSARIWVAVAMILVALGGGGCATSFEASTVAGAVKASNAFGFDLYRQAREGKDNFVCCPAGAAIALTMAAAGARGETQAEMLHALHIESANLDQTYTSFAAVLAALKDLNGKNGLSLSVADLVWVQKEFTFRPEYLSLLRERFRAPIAEADFKHAPDVARAVINQWASDETHGRIPQILAALDEGTRMVLANAVYMNAEWRSPFIGDATRDDWFTTSQGKIKTKIMRQEDSFRYAEVRGAKLVELPYKGGLSMIVVLPNDNDGLSQIEDRLASSYVSWIEALEYRMVDLELPRFSTETSLPLVESLKNLGMRLAFDACYANFSGMRLGPRQNGQALDTCVSRGDLYITQAIQKAWIETNELGTEAAAVTVVVMGLKVSSVAGPRLRRVVFHADHPFLYLIRDVRTGVILFAGRVVKPATASSETSTDLQRPMTDVPEE